jgi:hypothetical protein
MNHDLLVNGLITKLDRILDFFIFCDRVIETGGVGLKLLFYPSLLLKREEEGSGS